MKTLANKTVIVPYDFSDFAIEAIDQALEMAEETTSLHVVHVVEPVATLISMDPAMPILPSHDEDRQEHTVKQMKGIFETEKYNRFKIHCITGDPGFEIVKLAKSLEANLIVISSHGRTGLTRLLLGSVAERVLRLSDCPVLVLRKPKE